MRALTGAELFLAGAKLVNLSCGAGPDLRRSRFAAFDMLSEVVVDGFWTFLTSPMPVDGNTACAATTERLSRAVAGNSTLRVHWKGLLGSSGVRMAAGG